MLKRKSGVPFHGTEEQKKRLREAIEKHRNEKGALMPVLQEAQGIYGYLPIEVQQIVSKSMKVPLEEIYGVASFYTQFSLCPKGEYRISVCLGTACYVKGAQAILDRVSEIIGIAPGECTADGKFSLDATRCLGCCGLSPVMMINDEVYGKLVKDDVEKILEKYN